jgi:hypothetical protein
MPLSFAELRAASARSAAWWQCLFFPVPADLDVPFVSAGMFFWLTCLKSFENPMQAFRVEPITRLTGSWFGLVLQGTSLPRLEMNHC